MTAGPPSPVLATVPWLRGGVPFVLLALLCLLVHGPTLRGGFVYDDSWTILANPALRDPGTLSRLLGAGLGRADVPDAGRPVMLASVMLDWWLWGRAPLGYHLQNLLWHLGITLLLFAGLRRLTGRPGLAVAAAALHAVHPQHVEVVAAINYREDLLATFFLLVALTVALAARRYHGARRLGLRALALLAAVLACLSKESAYLGAALLVLVVAAERPRPERSSAARRGSWPEVSLLAGAALAIFVWRWWVFRAPGVVSATAELPAERFDRLGSLLAGARAFLAGMGQYLWPARLSPEYSPPSPGALVTIAGVVALLGLLLAAALALRSLVARGPAPPLAGLGFLWALATYVPHLGLVPLTNLRADRYLYLPGLGLALLVTVLGDRLLSRLPVRGAAISRRGPLIPVVLTATVLLLLAARSWRQGRIWRDDRTLFEAAVHAQPGSARAWRGKANAALHGGRTLEALAAADRALALSDDAHGHELRGLILMRQGALDQARAELLRALGSSGPGHRPRVLNNLGYVELERGDLEAALGHLTEARRLAPTFDRPWLNAARAHLLRGQPGEAQRLLEQLVAQIPGSVDGWVQLGAAFQRRGDAGQAAAAFQRARALAGGDPAVAAQLRRLED